MMKPVRQASRNGMPPEARRESGASPPPLPVEMSGRDEATQQQQTDRSGAAAIALLRLQADMRKASTLAELSYFIANETLPILRAQQIFTFASGMSDNLVVQTASSLTSLDRSSPVVLWVEAVVKSLRTEGHLNKIREFEATAFADEFASVVQAYPLRRMLWVPFISRDGTVGGGMILARLTPWGDQDITIATYLADAFSHAWASFERPKVQSLAAQLLSRRSTVLATVLAACAMAVPVPMTALAPVEIGPRDTAVVTAGIEGVIRSVEVEPNAEVKVGQRLVMLNDTSLRNRAEIAEREVQVADTKYKKAAQLAFLDARGRHEMAIARSELDLKLAERDFARELLQRAEIRAERAGVAFYADKKDLVGKPVTVGEKLMEIADPASSEFRIELPVADAIVLHDGARVKVFLDSDPLNPVEARLVRASYKAAPREAQQFSFRLVAEASGREPLQRLRLGMRGTAQIYSDDVPLGFYLFRRPIAAARQWSGL